MQCCKQDFDVSKATDQMVRNAALCYHRSKTLEKAFKKLPPSVKREQEKTRRDARAAIQKLKQEIENTKKTIKEIAARTSDQSILTRYAKILIGLKKQLHLWKYQFCNISTYEFFKTFLKEYKDSLNKVMALPSPPMALNRFRSKAKRGRKLKAFRKLRKSKGKKSKSRSISRRLKKRR